jgi:hypothetical protein
MSMGNVFALVKHGGTLAAQLVQVTVRLVWYSPGAIFPGGFSMNP